MLHGAYTLGSDDDDIRYVKSVAIPQQTAVVFGVPFAKRAAGLALFLSPNSALRLHFQPPSMTQHAK
jgi:hypothetical protein